MRAALGVVAILFALALLQPWNLMPARNGEVAGPQPVVRVSASAELEGARRCVRPAARRARPGCMRIHERRGGVETRLGKVRGSSRR
ncbi:MAG TPA: hypothetical protein VFL61_02640 [Gaiellaceae bacterium]|nr:hypothetical protein [Gaiellaceae bacterium]